MQAWICPLTMLISTVSDQAMDMALRCGVNGLTYEGVPVTGMCQPVEDSDRGSIFAFVLSGGTVEQPTIEELSDASASPLRFNGAEVPLIILSQLMLAVAVDGVALAQLRPAGRG